MCLHDPAVLTAVAYMNAKIVSVEKRDTDVTETTKKTTKKPAVKKLATIWEAILQARSIVEPIAKDSHCKMGGGGYDFLSTEKILLECMPILNDCGLVILPQDQQFDVVEDVPVMRMKFVLVHAPSGEKIELPHVMPIENMRQATKGSLAVRTTALSYVIRDILTLPRVEEKMPEVDNPDGGYSKKAKPVAKAKPATNKQIEYLRKRQAESADPKEFAKALDEKLMSKFGMNMNDLTEEVANLVINQFEQKRKENENAMANG